jgi:hypothetical protein
VSNTLLGYDTQKSSNKFIIFSGSALMGLLGFWVAYLNLHHHLNSQYLLAHIFDLNFYKDTLLEAYNYLAHVTFKKDFPFSFVWWWFVYATVLHFIFLFVFILLQSRRSKQWMKRLYLGESLIIALQSAFGFIVLAVIVYLATLVIAGWIFDVNKVIALRYYFMSYPILWGIVTLITVSIHEDESYITAIQYKIYPQLRKQMYITNMDQVPDGYSYEYVDFVESTATNNKDLADAYLLLSAYNMGANGILKYQADHTAYTHGTVTKYSDNTASGNLRTDHRHHVTGTAVRIFPNE